VTTHLTSDATSSHIRDEGAIATCIAIADGADQGVNG